MGTTLGYKGSILTIEGLYMVIGLRVPIRGPS